MFPNYSFTYKLPPLWGDLRWRTIENPLILSPNDHNSIRTRHQTIMALFLGSPSEHMKTLKVWCWDWLALGPLGSRAAFFTFLHIRLSCLGNSRAFRRQMKGSRHRWGEGDRFKRSFHSNRGTFINRPGPHLIKSKSRVQREGDNMSCELRSVGRTDSNVEHRSKGSTNQPLQH